MLVKTSVVALPTSVSVAAGRVSAPDATDDAEIDVDPLVAPFRLAEVPIQSALAIPTPPDTITEPVDTDVVSVTSVEERPLANGMRAVVAVCPSLQMAVDNPVAKSAVRALNTVDEMIVPDTTGCPVVLIRKVPLPLNAIYFSSLYALIPRLAPPAPKAAATATDLMRSFMRKIPSG